VVLARSCQHALQQEEQVAGLSAAVEHRLAILLTLAHVDERPAQVYPQQRAAFAVHVPPHAREQCLCACLHARARACLHARALAKMDLSSSDFCAQ